MDDASYIGAIEREPSSYNKVNARSTYPQRIKSDLAGMKSASGWTPLQDKENARGLESGELTAAVRSSSKVLSSVTRSLATPPKANIDNVSINTSKCTD